MYLCCTLCVDGFVELGHGDVAADGLGDSGAVLPDVGLVPGGGAALRQSEVGRGHVTSSPPITAHLLQLGLLQAQLLRLLSAQARQLQGAGPGHTRFVPGEC